MEEDGAVCEEMTAALRKQRHDFMNHIQVVHAYLQLGKVEKALAYLEKLAKDESTVQSRTTGFICRRSCARLRK